MAWSPAAKNLLQQGSEENCQPAAPRMELIDMNMHE